ncbi:hypothetical protein NE237_025655 [Protea cynaroides]|uniref:Uncharacterized protein n=1 Tax=Protea cynaroides TaxID=273540 RepID=A0A9Q0H3J4_9MAGN|nr:hypothetical protein NE237_025655 [Protea cynaroides]
MIGFLVRQIPQALQASVLVAFFPLAREDDDDDLPIIQQKKRKISASNKAHDTPSKVPLETPPPLKETVQKALAPPPKVLATRVPPSNSHTTTTAGTVLPSVGAQAQPSTQKYQWSDPPRSTPLPIEASKSKDYTVTMVSKEKGITAPPWPPTLPSAGMSSTPTGTSHSVPVEAQVTTKVYRFP